MLHGLRERYPHAKIDWLIAKPFAPFLQGHKDLDEVIPFDRRRFAYVGRKPSATAAFVRFVRSLRARRYELVVDLQGLFRTGFLSWASGAGVRIGFRRTREAAWVFYTHYLMDEEAAVHAVDRNYLVAKTLGFDQVPIQFHLPEAGDDEARVRALLRDAGCEDSARIVAVVPGARWETKVWLAERFATVIDRLNELDGVRCVLLGSEDEVPRCRAIAQGCRNEPINLAGRTGLRELVALIRMADVVLCHDSASMHLAVALDRPLVCLVGPTNPARTGPYRRMSDVIRADVPCAPCYLRKMRDCRHEHRCMVEVESARVVDAVMAALAESGGKGL